MKKKEKKIIRKSILVSLWIIVILFIIRLFFISENLGMVIDARYEGNYISKCKLNGKDVTLPVSNDLKKGKIDTVEAKLPKHIEDNTSLVLLSAYSIIDVYIDNEKIYSYGRKNALSFTHMIGNVYLIIPLEKSYAGKTLKIKKECQYNFKIILPLNKFTIEKITYGNADAFKLDILSLNVIKLVICSFLVIIALLALAYSVFRVILWKKIKKIYEYMYFAAFTICIAIWIFSDSNLAQFLLNKNEANTFVSFISLSIIGIPYMGYCGIVLPNKYKIFQRIKVYGSILPVVICASYLFNLLDPIELLSFSHLYSLLVIIVSFIVAVKDWNNDLTSKLLVLGMAWVGIFSIIGLVMFVAPNAASKRTYALFFGIGFVIFVFILLLILLIKEVRTTRKRLSMNVYKDMAYTDGLTKCGNRAALEREIEEGLSKNQYKYIGFFLFDLNNLKQINDKYGHEAGDELIQAGAECLSEGFEPNGKVYRLGGDEFAAVVWDAKGKIDTYLKKLDKVIKNYNQNSEYKVSVAKGYAEEKCCNEQGFFRKIYRMADQNMYEDKKSCHNKIENELKDKGD